MTEELLLWACSAAGAGLFFAAGRLAVRRVAVAMGPAPEAAAPGQVPRGATDLESRLAAAGQLEQTLRRELAAAEQRLEIGHQRVRQLEEENASLRAVPRDEVRTDSAELRARGSSRLRLRQPAATAGNRLQALIERVKGLGDFRSAVVADDLGLVVASQGELPDEVAAVGALFGQAALQAERELPLRSVQRVIVEGERGLVLAVRPLRLPAGVDLTLITLGLGAPPDAHQLSQLAGALSGDEPGGGG
jgi:predicted regulator of Ras-like GTPase activity (Roadblock/LC7/MglB family)